MSVIMDSVVSRKNHIYIILLGFLFIILVSAGFGVYFFITENSSLQPFKESNPEAAECGTNFLESPQADSKKYYLCGRLKSDPKGVSYLAKLRQVTEDSDGLLKLEVETLENNLTQKYHLVLGKINVGYTFIRTRQDKELFNRAETSKTHFFDLNQELITKLGQYTDRYIIFRIITVPTEIMNLDLNQVEEGYKQAEKFKKDYYSGCTINQNDELAAIQDKCGQILVNDLTLFKNYL